MIDAIVVGGGFAGATAARELSREPPGARGVAVGAARALGGGGGRGRRRLGVSRGGDGLSIADRIDQAALDEPQASWLRSLGAIESGLWASRMARALLAGGGR